MRALVALLLAATGCGASTELDPVTALESEYAGRSDLCFTHAALATDDTGALLIAYQEMSCEVATGERIGFAYRVRRWDGEGLRDIGFPLPVPAHARVRPPVLVTGSGGTVVLTAEGAFRWRGGEWVRHRAHGPRSSSNETD
jgi:hypothetical protein